LWEVGGWEKAKTTSKIERGKNIAYFGERETRIILRHFCIRGVAFVLE